MYIVIFQFIVQILKKCIIFMIKPCKSRTLVNIRWCVSGFEQLKLDLILNSRSHENGYLAEPYRLRFEVGVLKHILTKGPPPPIP